MPRSSPTHANRRFVKLPAPLHRNSNSGHVIAKTAQTEPKASIHLSVGELGELYLELVYQPRAILGSGMNTLIVIITWGTNRCQAHNSVTLFVLIKGLLALFGFGAAAWKIAPRDDFIGWTPSMREARLNFIVNNARFLILPWVQSKHLASKLLGLVARRLARDWNDHYGYCPVLLETFVEKERFQGTCYNAANWTFLGHTRGRGKLDQTRAYSLPVKSIWVYPLSKHFCKILIG